MSQDPCPKTLSQDPVPRPCPKTLSQDPCPKTLSQDPVPRPCPKTLVPRPCPKTLSQDLVPRPCPKTLSQDPVPRSCPKTLVPRPCPKTLSQDPVPRPLSQDPVPRPCPKTTVPRLYCPKTVPRLLCPKTSSALSQDCLQVSGWWDFFPLRYGDFLIRRTLYHHSSSSKIFPKSSLKSQMLTPLFLISLFGYLYFNVPSNLRPKPVRRYLVITCSYKILTQILTKMQQKSKQEKVIKTER